MAIKYRLLGLSGSLRKASFSTAVLQSLVIATAQEAEYDFADLGVLPHFNQDLFVEPLPAAVAALRTQIQNCDGIIISSPEYNHGVPSVLKNALEWASRPHNQSPLKDKPALIVTSSPAFTGVVRAQYQIREALVSALARPLNTPEVVVGLVSSKIVDGRFVDESTISFARIGFGALFSEIDLLKRA